MNKNGLYAIKGNKSFHLANLCDDSELKEKTRILEENTHGLKRYHISFNANGGDGSSCPVDYETYHNVILLPPEIPYFEDHDFLGWSLNCEDPTILQDAVIFEHDIILYAIWEEAHK